jgi:hypothetical protein
MDAKTGDWIRFFTEDQGMMIKEVLCIKPDKSTFSNYWYYTDKYQVYSTDVLEVRSEDYGC